MDSLFGFLMGFVIITRSTAALNVMGGGPVTTFTGESSELTCSFSPTNSPMSSYAWSFEGENGNRGQIGGCDVTQCIPLRPMTHQLTISADDGIGVMTLFISDTLLSDAGNYTCLVSTSEDAQSALVQLNVTECSVRQPNIACPTNVSMIGSFMDLECSYQSPDQTSGHFTRIAKIYLTDSLETVYANVPNFNISVTVNRDSIPNATEVSAELKLTSVCCRSESSLTCRASGGENLCSDVCITDVLYPPSDLVLTQSPTGPWRENMSDASILCRSNGFPSPTVSWQRVDAEGSSSSVILANGTGSSTLFFSRVQHHLAGVYRCNADNYMESVARKMTNISVQCYPDPPHAPHVVSYSESSLALSWTPGQDGGLPMTFTVSYCANVSEVERCIKEQDITNPQITINDLRSYTLYRITLLAENEIGTSGSVEILASTAPRTLEALGMSATYEIVSGKLDLLSTDSDIGDLCIHAEFHVGGLRKRNETCLLPGQTVYIRNGAKEHQLWLVVCGRGVCSSSSRVTYLDSIDGRWSLLFILVVTLGCCLGLTVLILFFVGLYRLTRGRQSWSATDFDAISSTHRALPLPPACALAIGLGSLSQRKDDAAEVQNYDAIQNIKARDEAFHRPPEGYMQMNAAKTTKASDQGIYTTHLQPGLNGSKEPEAIDYGNTEKRSLISKSDDKALKLDLHRIEVNDDTYTVAEPTNETGSDYMVPTSPRCEIKDTAV